MNSTLRYLMRNLRPFTVVFAGVGLAALLVGCSSDSVDTDVERPARVETGGDGGITRIILTERAVERLGIETAPVRNEVIDLPGATGAPLLRQIMPYSAVIYDPDGRTWVYTNPEPLVFERAEVTITFVLGEVAVLFEPRPPGSPTPVPPGVTPPPPTPTATATPSPTGSPVTPTPVGPTATPALRIGVTVVTVGVSELFGIEFGVGK